MLIPKFGGVGMYVGSEGVRARGGRSEVKKAKKKKYGSILISPSLPSG